MHYGGNLGSLSACQGSLELSKVTFNLHRVEEAGAPAAQAAAAPGDSTVEADEQRRRIRELVQELEDKNSELEEKSLIVSQLKEQMAQIIPLVGGLAPAGTLGSLEGLVLEQPEPETLAFN